MSTPNKYASICNKSNGALDKALREAYSLGVDTAEPTDEVSRSVARSKCEEYHDTQEYKNSITPDQITLCDYADDRTDTHRVDIMTEVYSAFRQGFVDAHTNDVEDMFYVPVTITN